ncbi:MAG: hypothetical protein HOH95_11705 [Dehalococcoidia bacterium]|jgi:phenylpyruvate tautomerase PptA (4-oxalocrotonate tautomerase family)|nr:hypothetical protein [Dehalococcoidia bacterium]
MPILDIDLVGDGAPPPEGLARQIADAAGNVLGSEPNGTWVRLRSLSPAEYAENGDAYAGAHPVLVTIIKADLGTPDELAIEAAALASAIAEVTGRDVEHVHVIYEPPGRGRVAFGGELLR